MPIINRGRPGSFYTFLTRDRFESPPRGNRCFVESGPDLADQAMLAFAFGPPFSQMEVSRLSCNGHMSGSTTSSVAIYTGDTVCPALCGA